MHRKVDILAEIERSEFGDSGRVAYLIQKPAPGEHRGIPEVDVLEGIGFQGDHARKAFWKGSEIPGREVTAVSIEVLRAMRIGPDIPGDNLITRGVDLTGLAEGDALEIGPVVLRRSAKPHRPCDLFRRRAGQAAFEVAAAGYRGALFTVERGGRIRVDDPIRVSRRADAGDDRNGGSP